MSIETVSVEQACERLGCGRSRLFELLAEGVIDRAPRFGRSLRLYSASIDRALVAGPKKPGRKSRAPTYLPEPVDRAALKALIRSQAGD